MLLDVNVVSKIRNKEKEQKNSDVLNSNRINFNKRIKT